MRRHPPKQSRKKMRLKIEKLKAQCVNWQMVLIMVTQAAQLQIACMQVAASAKRLERGGVVPDGDSCGTVVTPNTEGCANISKDDLDNLVVVIPKDLTQ